MSRLIERLERESAQRAREQRSRVPMLGRGVAFTSNDYLGLSHHPTILSTVASALERGVGIGSTGSRLLSGHRDEHRAAEESFAAFVGREASILFANGYLANLGLLSALPSRHDLLLLDSMAHASLKEGARAALATRRYFSHNDPVALSRALHDRNRFETVFVVVEGIYSMDGDAGELVALDRVAAEHDAHLIVDEAHATGLFGAQLRGMHEARPLERRPLATVHPCGKALGCVGGLVAADALVVEALVNTARPFIFSTAPAPLQAVAITAALALLPSMGAQVETVFRLARRLKKALAGLRRWRLLPSDGPIVAVIIGTSAEALRAADALARSGFDVRAIRPPTVPKGTARLRITITAEHTDSQIDGLANALADAERFTASEAQRVRDIDA